MKTKVLQLNVVERRLSTLSLKEMNLLYHNSDEGGMKCLLDSYFERERKYGRHEARIFMAYRGKRFVGWSCIVYFWNGSHDKQMWVYTVPQYRRKGIGSYMLRYAKARTRIHYEVCQWASDEGEGFFAAMNEFDHFS